MVPTLLSILTTLCALVPAHAQSRSREFTTLTIQGEPTRVAVPESFLDPTGVSGGTQTYSSVFPLICDSVCWAQPAMYGICFLDVKIWNSTDPTDYENFVQYTEDECAESLCDPDAYNHIFECLNCITANGGEGPSLTTPTGPPGQTRTSTPTSSAQPQQPPRQPEWPLGPIDEEQGNGWLRNITQFCEARGTAGLGGTEITATPTTTGPYEVTFTRGETITRSHWTQLATISQVIADVDAEQRSVYYRIMQTRLGGSPTPTEGSEAEPTPTSGSTLKAEMGVWAIGMIIAVGFFV